MSGRSGSPRIVSASLALIIGLLTAGALAGPAGAAPQGPWALPAGDLSATGGSAGNPQIAIAPDGSTTAVWYRFNGTHTIIQAATQPPGGAFGLPVDLSATGQNANTPQIAIAPDGSATAVWDRYDGTNNIIQASTRPPGGAFAVPVDLSAIGRNAIDPQIAIAPDGSATAVWRRFNGNNDIVQAATRPPSGAFGAPVDLSAVGRNAVSPQIAIAPDGSTTAVWSRPNGTNVLIQAATRPPGGAFAVPVDLSATGQTAFDPQIAIAPDGSATVVWRRYNSTHYIVQAATRPPSGTFGPPVDLSAIGQDANTPQIAIADDGSATVVWRRSNGTHYIVQAATRPPSGAFGTPVDLSVGQNAFDPQIAIAPDGSTTAV